MENEYFGIQFEPSSAPVQPNWRSLHSSMAIQSLTEFNSSTDHSPDSFFNPNSADQSMNFESTLSSLVSSPAASNSNMSSNMSNDTFVIRELIGKLGNINSGAGEISPPLNSRYSTPLNSPPKLNLPNLGNPMPLAEFSADPGFAERAARFSCFGSRSFNGRTNQLGYNRSNPVIENVNLSRVSSSPSLNEINGSSQLGNNNNQQNYKNNTTIQSELANSQEESSVSEQITNGDLNSKKRKSVSKGKAAANSNVAAVKDSGENVNSNAKRSKVKAEEKKINAGDEKQQNDTTPPEPMKDYIHVRARRGQATDSHSLAERVRREKISERMKLLQDLVPGCNKVTGKALMLNEIINYVQSLQRQVEFLSMKLASVNTRLDFNVDSLMSKDIFQSNNNTLFPLDSSASAFFGQQQNNISNGTMPLCSVAVDPLNTVHGFNQTLPQYSTLSEDDLQTIVQMGFGQNASSNQLSHVKIGL